MRTAIAILGLCFLCACGGGGGGGGNPAPAAAVTGVQTPSSISVVTAK